MFPFQASFSLRLKVLVLVHRGHCAFLGAASMRVVRARTLCATLCHDFDREMEIKPFSIVTIIITLPTL